ncbi:MAG: hypothetical protein HMLKMBBP_00200 [Planctomycetes bacterium]|nr:hypothetical protein [Planctomycetota bacterium]
MHVRPNAARVLLGLALAAAAAPAAAQEAPGAEGPRDLPLLGDAASPEAARKAWPGGASKSARAPARRVSLPPIDEASLRAQDEVEKARPGALAKRWSRVGVERATGVIRVPPRPSRWRDAETGGDGSRTWTALVESAGARGVRVKFSRASLPPGAELIVSDADEPKEAYGPLRMPEDGGFLMSPTVFGERVRVTLRVPEESLDRRVSLEIDGITHRYKAPDEPSHVHDDGAGLAANLSCMNNIACDATWNANVSRAVARYEFTSGGSTFLCSGTLLNDSDPNTTIPYFLTANHCVSTDKVARTMEFFWDYKASTCGGSPPSIGSVPRTVGAQLSVTSDSTDVTLVRITGTLPSNRYFCGWNAATPQEGITVLGVHHPEGEHMRISYGELTDRTGAFHTVTWDDGVTAQGSSGSALFNAQQQVIGQLCCGLSFCNALRDPDDYGRFDVSYENFLAPFLGDGQPPVPMPDAWDPTDDTGAGATDMGPPPGNAASHGLHTLQTTDPEDWFAFDLAQGTTYVFQASGPVRADLSLDAGGANVVAADSGVAGTGFRIQHVATATARHWLRVRRALASDTSYSLVYYAPAGELPAAVKRLRATVNRRGVVKLTWKDRAAGEQGYRVELEGPSGFVTLTNLGAGAKSYKHRPGPGQHTYRVGPYDANGFAGTAITVNVSGSPGLDAFDPEDDNGAGATDLGSDSFGTTSQHELDANDIADWYAIDLVAGNTYAFYTTGDGDTVGTIFADAGGTLELGYADDYTDIFGQTDYNFFLEYTPSSSGTHFLRVTAYPTAPRASYRLSWTIQ